MSQQLPDRPPVRCAVCRRNLGLAAVVLRAGVYRFCPDRRPCRTAFAIVRRRPVQAA